MLIFLSMLESEEDHQEFLKLYELYSNMMILVARKFFDQDHSSAEDAVQNAWVKVVENFSKILEIPCKKRGAYLVIIVRNESISLLRKRQNEIPFHEEMAGSENGMESDKRTILEIIRQMPPTYRAVLEMRFVEERNTHEISSSLHLTESAVNTRIHRGRALLIEKLEKEGYTI